MKTEKKLIKDIISKIDKIINTDIYVYNHHCQYNYHRPKYAEDAKKDMERAQNWKKEFVDTLTVEDIKHFRNVFLDDDVILMAVLVTKIFDTNKKVDVSFVKKYFAHNMREILKPEFLD